MEQLKREIAAGRLAPVYCFYGQEGFLKEEMAASIKAAAFDSEEDAACNTHVLYGPDLTLGELVGRASEYPMFSPRQLIIVRQFEKLKKTPGKEQQKLQEGKFTAYLQNPAEFTIMVLDAGQLDKKELDKPPFSLLKPWRREFPFIKNPDLFATERASQAGWEFDPDALKAFTAYIQPSSREICQEIDKLILFASSRNRDKRITAPDVYECVGISKTYNVFELEKAVAARNLRLCSGISLMIMETEGQKEGLMNIVRYLTTFFMRLWKLSQPGIERLPQGELARLLGMYGKQEYFVKNYLGYRHAFPAARAENALEALRETDAALKGMLPYPDEKYLLLRLMQRILG